MTPLGGVPPVAPKANFNALTGQGYYRSRSAFQSAGPYTCIMNDGEIQAAMPKRLEWKLIPDVVITRVVEDVLQPTLNDILDTFIARSIDGLRL